MDVSRSGRIRKKSSKLADFESPDDLELKREIGGGREPAATSKPKKQSREYASSSSSFVLYDPDAASPEDLDELQEADYEIKEEDLDAIPYVAEGEDDLDDVDVEGNGAPSSEVESLRLSDQDEGTLQIDESKGGKSKSKPVVSSIYFSEKKRSLAGGRQGGDVAAGRGQHQGGGSKKTARRDKGKPRFSAYMLWAKAQRNKVVADNPGMDFSGISKRLGEIWSSVPMSEKWSWKRKASILCAKTIRQQMKQQQLQASTSATRPESSSPKAAEASTSLSMPPPPAAPFKVTGTDPLDCAAYLKLLGESLSVIGERLMEHEGQIAVSGSLSVLLDSMLCSVAPLLCLTRQIPELDGIPKETVNRMLDNIAYIMPGL